MKYVQATKPEKHNGGFFFEHEIHLSFNLPTWRFDSKKFITEMESRGLVKGVDYRMTELRGPWDIENRFYPYIVRVRFADKEKALLFKLSWQE